MNGVQVKHNARNGFAVVFLHYSAHPLKTSEEFKRIIKEGFTSEQAFKREYELDFTTLEGSKIFGEFSPEQVVDLDFNDSKPIHRSFDWGWRSPACTLSQYNDKNQWLWMKAFVGKEMQTTTFLDISCWLCGQLSIELLSEPAMEYINIHNMKPWIGYPSNFKFVDYCDTAGTAKSDKAGIESNIFIASQPPYNMRLRHRRANLEGTINMTAMRMRKRNDGNYGILVNASEKDIIQGLMGGFVRDTHGKIPDNYYTNIFDSFRYVIANTSNERMEQNLYAGRTEDWSRFIKTREKPAYAII